MLKKRIASLITAVVIILTAANFMPFMTSASAPGTETDASQTTKTDADGAGILTAMGAAMLSLASGNVTVASKENTNWSNYVDVSGTERTWTGSAYNDSSAMRPEVHHTLIVTDAEGKKTVGYCMQSAYETPPAGGAEYTEGYRKTGADAVSQRQVSGAIAMSRFAYGGTNADPNIDAWSTGTSRNTDDGGTYGTYLIQDGNSVKAVRGLMIGGKVYPLSPEEAATLSAVLVHCTTDHSSVTSISNKPGGSPAVEPAFKHLQNIANAGMAWYDTKGSFDAVAELMDGQSHYQPKQEISWSIYNPSSGKWEPYASTNSISRSYADASGNIKLKIDYRSSGMCNNLTTNTSADVMTVEHNFSEYSVGSSSAFYDYFKIKTEDGNNVPFTVCFDKITAAKESVTDSFAFNYKYERDIFLQTAYVTVSAEDLSAAGAELAITAYTENGAAATPYKGADGKYASRMFHNDNYQDCFFVSPNSDVQKSSSIYAGLEVLGSIEINKYSADKTITDGNACYSLKGAVFGVFRTRADAEAATVKNEKAVTTIITDEKGCGKTDGLTLGTYYIKETKAPKGYRINSTVYTARLNTDTLSVKLDVSETPGNDPASVLVQKKDSDNTDFLEGAVFAIRYYDVQMETDPALSGKTALRTWYIKTNVNGYADIRDSKYLLPNSDELFYHAGYPTIPIGTITVQETEAPEGYIIDSTVRTFKITDNPEGIPHIDIENERTIPNSPMKQPFELTKIAADIDGEHPLAGAGFTACRTDALTEVPAEYQPAEGEVIVSDDSGKFYIWDETKAVILTEDGKTEMFTDEEGYARSIPLEYGTYIVKETTVPEDYLPVEEFTVHITENSDTAVNAGTFVDELAPEIHTIAKDSVTLDNTAETSKETTLVDTVMYKNLIPGKEYVIRTILRDKETDKPLRDINGNEITAETKFTPETAEGSIDISVTFDSSMLAGKDIVFFEYLYRNGKLVAVHADIEDEGQTITFPPETPPETPPDTPKTGDGFPVVMTIILAVISLIGIAALILIRKKGMKNE